MDYSHSAENNGDRQAPLPEPKLSPYRWLSSNSVLTCFLIGIVLLVYSNIYSNQFLYDDEALIIHNQFLRQWHNVPRLFLTSLSAGYNVPSIYYRPLQTLLYMIVFQTAGLSLFGFHFLNVVLHALNACLVFALGQKLNFKRAASFLAALLWALHPVQTEAVTYISATADPLYTSFCLLGVIVLLPDFTTKRMAIALPLMVLGCLSKEAAVSFPLLAMSCLYFFSTKKFSFVTYRPLWPLALVMFVYVVLHYLLLPHASSMNQVSASPPPSSGNYAPIAALTHYVGLLLFPIRLHMGHEMPIYSDFLNSSVVGGLVLIVLTTLQILRKEASLSLPISWGLLWFFAALLPSLFSFDMYYEHWMYLPTVGLFLGFAQSLALALERLPSATKKASHMAVMAVTLVSLVTVSVLTYRQNFVWRDPVTFYNNIFAAGEKAARAHINLGAIYIGRHEYEKAAEQSRLAIANSHDTIAAADANLGVALFMSAGDAAHDEEALKYLERALAIDPECYQAYIDLAAFYDKKGDAIKAKTYRDQAASLHQKFVAEP